MTSFKTFLDISELENIPLYYPFELRAHSNLGLVIQEAEIKKTVP
ncbi:hypothetical protein VCHA34P129_140082 [Vibrio chagasii]|nr:hypothetical protein VCHA34P129_140082 [Vibrio chagasii]CAH6960103.1 hypothetical protein VCHA52P455_130082 [Vibrio chagasii]